MRKEDCLFCKIVAGEIPSTKVYEDERVLAFEDVSPQMPVHTLIVPKDHYLSLIHIFSLLALRSSIPPFLERIGSAWVRRRCGDARRRS